MGAAEREEEKSQKTKGAQQLEGMTEGGAEQQEHKSRVASVFMWSVLRVVASQCCGKKRKRKRKLLTRIAV